MTKNTKSNKEKIAVCPYCKNGISTLINAQSGINYYEMDSEGNYDKGSFEPDNDYNVWLCPDCMEEITNNEETAILFLQGKYKINIK
ncbi:MAG: hypothetical protein QXP59_00715 [Saccharolobus sp.]